MSGRVFLVREEDTESNQYGETWMLAKAAKELIRCKDCKYGIVKESIVLCTKSNVRGNVMKPEDYCSKAERRKYERFV